MLLSFKASSTRVSPIRLIPFPAMGKSMVDSINRTVHSDIYHYSINEGQKGCQELL